MHSATSLVAIFNICTCRAGDVSWYTSAVRVAQSGCLSVAGLSGRSANLYPLASFLEKATGQCWDNQSLSGKVKQHKTWSDW
jgi:hypothetical protein